jgi:ribosomal protein S11
LEGGVVADVDKLVTETAIRCARITLSGFGRGRYAAAVAICREFGIDINSVYDEADEPDEWEPHHAPEMEKMKSWREE